MRAALAVCVVLVIGVASSVSAQDRRNGSVEGIGGWAGFVDDDTIGHSVFGIAAKWNVSPRVALGPELVYMIGPRSDRDLMLTGNVTVDLFDRPVTPFFVVGGGLFRHSDDFGGLGLRGTFSSTEGAFTAGGGVRIAVNDRFYIAPEARLGWELHTRLSVAAGWRF
jgi:opacity protein-like surface antigen